MLVLPGKRDITHAFYIEPTTGYGKATDDCEYLGIESVWNHRNLWVNMQDCSSGCQVSGAIGILRRSQVILQSLEFNLDDQTRWESMFPHTNEDPASAVDEQEEKLTETGRKRPFTTLSNKIDWFDATSSIFSCLSLPSMPHCGFRVLLQQSSGLTRVEHSSDLLPSEISRSHQIGDPSTILSINDTRSSRAERPSVPK